MSRVKAVWSRIRSTKGLGRDVSIFAGIVVLGLGVAGYILANQRVIWPWDERVTYVAEFSEVPGVVAGQGQEVRIAGVAVGDIVGTEVSDEGRARLKLSLRKEHGAVYDNAQLVLRPKSPLNEMYILLDPGGPPGRKLESGDAIPGVRLARPIQIEEVLGHLDEDTRRGHGRPARRSRPRPGQPGRASAGFKAADATMAALQPVAEALESRRDKIATLVSALGDIAAAVGEDDARLAGLVDSARATLGTLARHDGDFDATLAQLPGFTDDLRAATGALAGLAGELNPTLEGLRKASGTLPPALAGLTDVVEKVGTTVAMARPVVDGAKPLVADLRPFVNDARVALDDLSVVTGRFDPITANVVKYLGHIADFAYNSNSMVSPEDANGPLLRGLVTIGRESDPSGQVAHSVEGGCPMRISAHGLARWRGATLDRLHRGHGPRLQCAVGEHGRPAPLRDHRRLRGRPRSSPMPRTWSTTPTCGSPASGSGRSAASARTAGSSTPPWRSGATRTRSTRAPPSGCGPRPWSRRRTSRWWTGRARLCPTAPNCPPRPNSPPWNSTICSAPSTRPPGRR